MFAWLATDAASQLGTEHFVDLGDLCGECPAGVGDVDAPDAAVVGVGMASDERAGPFSFVTICDVLDLDPDSVRAAMARLRNARAGFVRPRVSAGRGRHQINGKRRRSHDDA